MRYGSGNNQIHLHRLQGFDTYTSYKGTYNQTCIKCGKNDLPTTSMMDAERILQEYLKSANQWEEEYSLEPTDPVVGEIDNNEVYRFEVRYKENVEEVGSRLINNYAITMDGKTIFLYDPANDQWIIQK